MKLGYRTKCEHYLPQPALSAVSTMAYSDAQLVELETERLAVLDSLHGLQIECIKHGQRYEGNPQLRKHLTYGVGLARVERGIAATKRRTKSRGPAARLCIFDYRQPRPRP